MKSVTLYKVKNIAPEQWFMLSVVLVNGGNYLYNLLLGRFLGPDQFADAAVMITLLLVLSFFAMTYQLVSARYAVLLNLFELSGFLKRILKSSMLLGVVIGALMMIFSKSLQQVFNTNNSDMFMIFGACVPLYFLLSINRGYLQGTNQFKKLAFTYQGEMFTRLILTFVLLIYLNLNPIFIVAAGIFASLVLGLFPFKISSKLRVPAATLSTQTVKEIQGFFIITLFYELTQIIINNSDILLVKHYFDGYEAGLYASLALIGRVVYFMAWMFVMLLLPKVVRLQKEGKPTKPLLFKYVFYIGTLCVAIVIGAYLFPEFAVSVLFGDAYLSIAPLLWKYALATSLFAIANIFSYYFLSLKNYVPVIISGLLGVSQVLSIIFWHHSLEQVVEIQVILMSCLMVSQLVYFQFKESR